MVTSSGPPLAPPQVTDLPPLDLVTAQLYGGAMRMQVPRNFTDVSRIRQLPDNQEVYTDFTTDQSLIVEIVEPPTENHPTPNGDAAWHWQALCEDAGATQSALHWAGTSATTGLATELAERLPRPRLTLAAGRQRVAKFKDNDALASDVRVHLACVALPAHAAHILISFAAPQALHPEGASARAGATAAVAPADAELPAAAPFYYALRSLTVVDWGLFG